MTKLVLPRCKQQHIDCFAIDDLSFCHILNNTEFPKKCPFFKCVGEAANTFEVDEIRDEIARANKHYSKMTAEQKQNFVKKGSK